MKIGDLGLGKRVLLDARQANANAPLVHKDGARIHCQPHAMRAPEVLEGRECTVRSAVWAVGATLLCWIKSGILGLQGNKEGSLYDEAWCIAKLRNLFPSWTPSPLDDGVIPYQFALAEECPEDPALNFPKILSLEEELETVFILPELKNLLRLVLVVNPKERPTPAEVLASQEYWALTEKARASHEVEV